MDQKLVWCKTNKQTKHKTLKLKMSQKLDQNDAERLSKFWKPEKHGKLIDKSCIYIQKISMLENSCK